ncbi:MAG TPA: glucose-1-phosphate adenylyltransferase subunit GlgD [Bacillota bacterium]|nr:glucose-1-phosphate adenylyltransferase subunit GlgD [Bacillota bacterium]HPE39165.1 glucose-1-phosphate adenylyltransferase subunit GlgD [Bacillota bacterium]
MFIDAMGLIFGDNKKITLGELSRPRALSAIPFGGRYRIIDYMLSNMVNSGIKNVGILTYNKYKSLMDHVGTGASWDLDRKNFGLHILPPYVNSEATSIEGDEEMAGLLDFIRSSRSAYVIIANSNVILNTTFNEFVEDHKESGADISVMYNRDGTKYGSPNYILEVDRKGMVKDMLFNPEKSSSSRSSLGIITMRRELLIDLIAEMMARGSGHMGIHSFVKMYDTLKVHAYEYKGLILRINSVQTYFNSSMLLLDNQVRADLFWNGMPIYTKVKDEAPTLYSDSCHVSNSIISDGCRIAGSVEDSMLFRGVAVSKNCDIKNCVIMQDVHISENCHLENVILDKNSVIRPGIKLVGHKDYPVVIGKGAIV